MGLYRDYIGLHKRLSKDYIIDIGAMILVLYAS